FLHQNIDYSTYHPNHIHFYMKKYGFIPAALILGIAFIVGVIIFTHTWHSNYKLNQTISVTGSAIQTFTSNIGYLSATIEAKAPTSKQAFQKLQAQKPEVINF